MTKPDGRIVLEKTGAFVCHTGEAAVLFPRIFPRVTRPDTSARGLRGDERWLKGDLSMSCK
ncbi:hypothetical protein BBJ41_23400 [Burkholderia stabilis]|nr:hypothetical protein BBJ41_23400 [Burkholderia stabilis]